jgi:hypothetical protein
VPSALRSAELELAEMPITAENSARLDTEFPNGGYENLDWNIEKLVLIESAEINYVRRD